ncbi:sugar phosphate nucleotidyltransferase, partial [Vibrio parahaemolyticus]
RVNGNHSGILLEPVGRNTAPAIALAAKFALSKNQTSGEDALMLVLAADHVIKDTQSFHQSVQAAIPYAQRGDMVTFGIKANAPET